MAPISLIRPAALALLCGVSVVSAACPPFKGDFVINDPFLHPENLDFDSKHCKVYIGFVEAPILFNVYQASNSSACTIGITLTRQSRYMTPIRLTTKLLVSPASPTITLSTFPESITIQNQEPSTSSPTQQCLLSLLGQTWPVRTTSSVMIP